MNKNPVSIWSVPIIWEPLLIPASNNVFSWNQLIHGLGCSVSRFIYSLVKTLLAVRSLINAKSGVLLARIRVLGLGLCNTAHNCVSLRGHLTSEPLFPHVKMQLKFMLCLSHGIIMKIKQIRSLSMKVFNKLEMIEHAK